jgi:hypothetical protein
MEVLSEDILSRLYDSLDEYDQLCMSHVCSRFLQLAEKWDEDRALADKKNRLLAMEKFNLVCPRSHSFRTLLRALRRWDATDGSVGPSICTDHRDCLRNPTEGKGKVKRKVDLSELDEDMRYEVLEAILDSRAKRMERPPQAIKEREAIVNEEECLEEIACDAACSLMSGQPLLTIISLHYFYRLLLRRKTRTTKRNSIVKYSFREVRDVITLIINADIRVESHTIRKLVGTIWQLAVLLDYELIHSRPVGAAFELQKARAAMATDYMEMFAVLGRRGLTLECWKW